VGGRGGHKPTVSLLSAWNQERSPKGEKGKRRRRVGDTTSYEKMSKGGLGCAVSHPKREREIPLSNKTL